ncbi:PqqD family peptide modification chaperone [Emticicia soli]|uniref:PqqD family peptide modification chaperone n=1 Tax=Emticicia soli TaxID=2027878 RepID=A0ABW5J1J3_9BACT
MNNLHIKIIRNDELFLFTNLGDEAIMMNTSNGVFMELNRIAVDIWMFLQEPISVENLIKKLTDKYEVDESVCKNETVVYLQKMLKEKMLHKLAD